MYAADRVNNEERSVRRTGSEEVMDVGVDDNDDGCKSYRWQVRKKR